MFFKKKESYSRFLEEPFSIVHNIDSNVWCTPIEIEEREIGMDRMSGWFQKIGMGALETYDYYKNIDEKYFKRDVSTMAFLVIVDALGTKGQIKNSYMFDLSMKCPMIKEGYDYMVKAIARRKAEEDEAVQEKARKQREEKEARIKAEQEAEVKRRAEETPSNDVNLSIATTSQNDTAASSGTNNINLSTHSASAMSSQSNNQIDFSPYIEKLSNNGKANLEVLLENVNENQLFAFAGLAADSKVFKDYNPKTDFNKDIKKNLENGIVAMALTMTK